jgi:hypothetical protein
MTLSSFIDVKKPEAIVLCPSALENRGEIVHIFML